MSGLRIVTSALLLLLSLTACASLNSPQREHKETLDHFMHALRWRLHPEAAACFTTDHGAEYLARMEALNDLNVTDVRLKRIVFSEEGRRADTVMEMDYFILPSTTLKTVRIEQIWRYFDAEGAPRGFLITTPFPELR